MHRRATSIVLLVVLPLLFALSHAHTHISRIRPNTNTNSHHQTHHLSVTVHATTKAAPAPANDAPAPTTANDAPAPSTAKSKAKPPAAAAPPPPANLTSLMAKKSCKSFADLLSSTPDAASTFQSSVDGGITIFCPSDSAVKSFMHTFKNLTSDAKLSVLLFHAVPVYYSLDQLKSNNGVMNTLATDGTAKNFNFTLQNDGDHITLKTASDSPAKITGTVFDKEPVAIFSIDSVMQPEELFAPVEAPAPSPGSVADSPKPAKGKKSKKHQPVADAPGPDSADASDQQAADENAAVRVGATRWFGAVALMVIVVGWLL
ncbi:Fasciclin-like arabinogalactan family protein [Rhynchospora pubera]|uniref:Fasciclin-like arabinogalactan family protein n=1 Tax=Rhynchospora pubera TaxID=906938 RepID=A0AAV8E084_9POAL|nr:Fasciclin-like arabinogalactan family protein [Rhynchospora pubera]